MAAIGLRRWTLNRHGQWLLLAENRLIDPALQNDPHRTFDVLGSSRSTRVVQVQTELLLLLRRPFPESVKRVFDVLLRIAISTCAAAAQIGG